MDWLGADVLQREVGARLVISRELGYNLQILAANEKQEMVADEIFHILLTNEKQEKL
jgi:hypothetical protein